MTDPASDLSPLGELLEDARKRLDLSKREAARRAGFSETRWRQIVTGWQDPANRTTPANPPARTVAAAARAVGIDVQEALRAAGLPPLPPEQLPPAEDDDPIRRILTAGLPIEQQEAIIKRLVREQNAAQTRINALVDQLIAEVRDQR